jgi:hypothetical protein
MLAELRFQPRELVRIDVAELAAFGEIADVVGETVRSARTRRAGRATPGSCGSTPRAAVLVEHHDAIGHVVEGDAQFGLTLADFVEQPRVLDRDDRLRREVLQQRDLLVGERPDFLAKSPKSVVVAQRDPERVRARPRSTTSAGGEGRPSR